MNVKTIREDLISKIQGDDNLSRKFEIVVDHVDKITIGDLFLQHDLLWFTEENGNIKVHIDKNLINAISNGNFNLFENILSEGLKLLSGE